MFSPDLQQEEGQEDLADVIARWTAQYQLNKLAAVGTQITCPCCHKRSRKGTAAQAFHDRKCKNRYWNLVDPGKRSRAMVLRRGRR